MLLVDPPRWPAHGTLFGHLVSDASLTELHQFADHLALPWRAFDHDHYDLPVHRHADAVEAGALPVAESELIRRLVASGLRVRTPDRWPTRAQVLPELLARWPDGGPVHLRDALLARWSQPHRHYHDVRHLWQLLRHLDELGPGHQGARQDELVLWAAWFHDAVHEGRAGQDEQESAELALTALRPLMGAEDAGEVARVVLTTAGHDPDPGDVRGTALCDADLAVLALPAGRYDVYVRDVRSEYSHLSDAQWRAGRTAVLEQLLGLPRLFGTHAGARLWDESARLNLTRELARWQW